MKKNRNLLLFLLAGCMVCGAVGCVNGKNSEKNAEAEDAGKRVEAPEGALEKYSETVSISTVMPENPGIQWKDGDSYDDNPWYRAYLDRLNIKVTNDWVSNEYVTKINLAISDKIIPDVFCVSGQQLIDEDLIWDMTKIFDKYASDRLKIYMKMEADTADPAGDCMGLHSLLMESLTSRGRCGSGMTGQRKQVLQILRR